MGLLGHILVLLTASHLLVLAATLLMGAATLNGSTIAGLIAIALLLLPPILLAAIFPQRAWTVPIVMLVWSLITLLAAPALLPYPAATAVDAGLGLFGATCSGIGRIPYAVLPDLSGQQPVTIADCTEPNNTPPPEPTTPEPATPDPATPDPATPEPATPDPATPDPATPDPATSASFAVRPGDVEIHYTLDGSSIIVPVLFEGPGGTLELPMIFDTGATLTTLNAARLGQLGRSVAADAPQITSHTAGGLRTSQITQMTSLTIGGHRVSPVTISECEPCAAGMGNGLLGMNVSGRFLIMIDTAQERLVLRPREGGETRDVEPWVELSAEAMQQSDGSVEISLSARNRSPHDIAWVEVQINCDQEYTGTVTDIPAAGTAAETITLPVGTQCSAYTIQIVRAMW